MGSSSSTARHSGWVDQERCGCGSEYYYRAFHIAWKEYPMVNEAAEFGINTGRVVAAIATLGISTKFNGGIKAPLHDAVLVSIVCDRCGKSFYGTFEFGPGGSNGQLGRYKYHRNVVKSRSVNVPARMLMEIYHDMPQRSYCAINFNCSHWAHRFFYGVCNKSQD